MHTLFWHVLAREDSPVLICLDHTLSFVSILFYRILPFFNAFLSTVSICIYLYLFVSICIYLYLLSFTFCYPTPAQCMVSVYCFCVRNMNVGTIPPQPQPQTWVYRAPLGRFGEQWVINGLTVMIPPLALIWSYLILFALADFDFVFLPLHFLTQGLPIAKVYAAQHDQAIHASSAIAA